MEAPDLKYQQEEPHEEGLAICGRRGSGTSTRYAAVLVVAVLATGSVAAALDCPEQIPGISVRKVRWQALPDQLCRVFAAPDGRAWYELAHPARREDLPTVRRIIEREFKKPAPQLFGASPALFEPGGRVWFVTHSQTVLLGYDGRKWIEREPGKDRYFTGTCPNHGRRDQYYSLSYNRRVAKRAFFPDSHGVHCFDGKGWSYQQIRADDDKELHYPLLLPEPGGGLVVVLRGSRPSCWLWRDGRWERKGFEPTIGRKERGLAGAIPTSKDGCWLFTSSGPVYLNHDDKPPPNLAKWLAALGDDDYQTREEATRTLVGQGTAILPHIEKARSRTKDPEVLDRLAKIAQELSNVRKATIRLGPYDLHGPVYLDSAADGAGFVGATHVREGNKDLGPGMVVHDGKGQFRFVAGKGLVKLWHARNSIHSGVLVAKPGLRWWVPGDIHSSPARLLDFKTGQFVDALPETRFVWLHCVLKDGTVFAGPDVPGTGACPVKVYRPGAPDDRRLLRGEKTPVQGEQFCVAPDGSIWVETVEPSGVARFDGKAWKSVEALADVTKVRAFLPGRGGWMLVQTARGFSLAGPGGCWQNSNLKSLVAAHREEFATAFAAGPGLEGDSPWGRRPSLAADRAGNIWFHWHQLEVSTKDGWIDAGKALKAAGSRVETPAYMAPVGDGSRVYVSDMMLAHDRGRSFLAGLRDGRPTFSKAPHTTDRRAMCPALYDQQGALWVNGYHNVAAGTCDFISGQLAHRVTEKGAVASLGNRGWAKLCDRSGNVWLGSIRGKSRTKFNIWREGRIADSVTVQSANESSHMGSDRPGSVYVLTRRGCHHLVAAEPAQPAHFTEKAIYALDGVKGLVKRAAVSKLGYLAVVVCVRKSDGKDGFDLHLFPLPKP